VRTHTRVCAFVHVRHHLAYATGNPLFYPCCTLRRTVLHSAERLSNSAGARDLLCSRRAGAGSCCCECVTGVKCGPGRALAVCGQRFAPGRYRSRLCRA